MRFPSVRRGETGLDVEGFIERWTAREGGAERANYQMFLSELCDVLGVPRPEPAGGDTARNDYAFERAVRLRAGDGGTAPRRIDLYRRGHFILEAKQSRFPGAKNAPRQVSAAQLSRLAAEPEQLGRRAAAKGWDVMMQNARRQAEGYVFLLDPEHVAPPFLITCDVGHALEVFADFSGTGRAYVPFPDRQGFRIFLEDLRDPAVRTRLAAIWTDPGSLDPARHAARATREIAARLAAVSKALEADHAPEEVAHFLMRCIFTMFAEGVDLLPKGKFTKLLAECAESPGVFAPLLSDLWAKMDAPREQDRFFSGFQQHLRLFNGNLFSNATAFPLAREEIGELLAAARKDWTEVDPAIFGTLLEQALDKAERRRLGAHYTPRVYVQRLVEATVMQPLRADWQAALMRAETAHQGGDEKAAVGHVRAFHRTLCATRVLDPACGTGNFLYVALELMKTLEGEVLETLARLGEAENMGLDRETVDPHQFLGLELNPRAAAIAELVVWIGYLQQHYRTRTGHPSEPILRAFKNINFGRGEGYDAVLTWDGYPLPTIVEIDGRPVETYPKARRPDWPDAEFIVGNPPFIAGSDLRGEYGHGYASAVWAAYPNVPGGADFVMCWWDRSAVQLAGPILKRFGFVTTNKIAQGFSRKVVAHHLGLKRPIRIAWAIDDHPWYRGKGGVAQVRIAMTVGDRKTTAGRLLRIKQEKLTSDEQIAVEYVEEDGIINADLTIGADITKSKALLANRGCSHDGVKLHGKRFVLNEAEAGLLGVGTRAGIEEFIRPYRNGLDLRSVRPSRLVIDMYGLAPDDIRARYPEAYQRLLEVRDERQDAIDQVRLKGREPSKDVLAYRDLWWLFGKPRPEMRFALANLGRYIGTIDTARKRLFQFIDSDILCDDKIVVMAIEDAATLSILSSHIHVTWAERSGGWLGVGNDSVYSKTRCFDPFPFPELSAKLRMQLRTMGEELDSTRKVIQEENPDLGLTEVYKLLDLIRAGAPLSSRDEDVRTRGRVLILRELHDTIDRLTADAYGWPHGLSDADILVRLVALNAERAREEAAGHVRWLRPDYQVPRFAGEIGARTEDLDLGEAEIAIGRDLPAFPTDRSEQPLAVVAILRRVDRPMDAAALSRGFKRGGRRIEARVAQILATLSLYGHIVEAGDGRFLGRRAA
ncbi:class I SAM-dependent DNA methyltransferase [Methylobacterium sp. WL103]|uniref:DNA methyltransferase n=2 Tax=unclassified Methylobacterium TaxID=2615210 RepID=UPI0011C9EF80|nr:class I SAM-dependent DNA methyltransferase [Methylobacterium sp. WL103]